MHTPRPVPNRIRALGLVACLALSAVACGDDDEAPATADEAPATADEAPATADEAAASDDEAAASDDEYCVLATEINEQDGPPTPEQLEALRDAGPDEISEELDVVVGAFIAAEGDFGKAFADPAVEENLGAIEAYEADVCGLGGGGGEEEPETEPIEGAQVIQVTGVDYAFEGVPADIPAGPTSFEFTNEGEDAHEIALFKLGEDVDLDALLAAEEEPSDEEAQEMGFTFAPAGQGGVYLNVEDLQPGTYAMVCFIPGAEGKPHHDLGMKTTFTVG